MNALLKVLLFGSHGIILSDSSGKVLASGFDYGDITKVDVDEYLKWAKEKTPSFVPEDAVLIEADIEEFGYWVGDVYVPANKEFRDHVEKVANPGTLHTKDSNARAPSSGTSER